MVWVSILLLVSFGEQPCSIRGPSDAGGLELHITMQGADIATPPTVETLTLDEIGSAMFPRPENATSIRLQAPGYWAAPVSLDRAETDCTLALHPAGLLQASLPPEHPEPERVTVRFEPLTEDGALETPCELRERSISCVLPAGRHDLKLQVGDHVPHYLWDREIAVERPLELGQLTLELGASVSGFLIAAGRPDGPLTAELRPVVYGWHGKSTERRRVLRRTMRATADPRGFFQIVGVPPGQWTLEARGDGLGNAVLDALRVDAGRELALPPIELEPLATAALALQPAVDPYGHPWQLRLRRADALTPIAETQTLGGDASFPNLDAGAYEVLVDDSTGASWRVEPLDVYDGMPTRFLGIDVVPIEGRVTIGDEPLVARVIFGGATRPRLTFETDEDGAFEGSLPREGLWRVDLETLDLAWNRSLEPIDVLKRPGRPTAEVDIALPDTRIEGQVLYKGQPAERAGVLINDAAGEGKRIAGLLTDEDGTFELLGAEPGPVQVMAYRDQQLSEWHAVTLAEGNRAEVTIQIVDKVVLSGRLVTPNGQGVGGANIVGLAADQPFKPWRDETMSSVDGTFTLAFPDPTANVDLLITAPGAPITVTRVSVVSEPRRSIVLSTTSCHLELLALDPDQSYTLTLDAAAMPLNELWITGSTYGWASSSASGGLQLQGFATGEYRFCAVDSGQCVQSTCSEYEPLLLATPPLAESSDGIAPEETSP